jgi:hypothetical protein
MSFDNTDIPFARFLELTNAARRRTVSGYDADVSRSVTAGLVGSWVPASGVVAGDTRELATMFVISAAPRKLVGSSG